MKKVTEVTGVIKAAVVEAVVIEVAEMVVVSERVMHICTFAYARTHRIITGN